MNNNPIYDVIIIGSGPAGYTAALYSARALRNVILFTGTGDYNLLNGGQLTTTTEIENFPGIMSINGYDLVQNMREQSEKYGTTVIEKTILSINDSVFPFTLIDENNKTYRTRSIIIATGSNASRLNLPNEQLYWNKGISACAVCDGALPRFRGKVLVVVGGGDTAMEEALFLSKYASKVLLLVRSNKLKASKIMIQRVESIKKIEILYNTEIDDVIGDSLNGLTGIILKNKNPINSINVSGLFYAIGHKPNTEFLKNTNIQLDEHQYIKTINKSTKTNINGIFACGDVQDYIYRQAIVAAGTGSMAALDVEEWLNSLTRIE